MDTKQRTKLLDELEAAIRKALQQASKKFKRRKKKIFGCVLIPNSGFTDFGLAFGFRGTDESPDSGRLSPEEFAELSPRLQETLRKYREETGSADDPNETVASEWQNFGVFGDCFDGVYELITPWFETWYEQYEPEEIGDFLESVCTDVLKSLVASNAFSDAHFDTDVLTGIQFADPDRADRVIRVSSQVNSDFWHNRVSEYFSAHVEERKSRKKKGSKVRKKK